MFEYDGNYIEIIGLKGKVTDVNSILKFVNDLSEEYGCIIQLMNASAIAGELHVYQACIQSINSFNREINIAKDLGMEICVRASAQRQISKAIKILGLKKGENNICAVIIKENDDFNGIISELLNNFEHDNSVLVPNFDHLREIYSVPSEIEPLTIHYFIEKTSILTLDA